MTSNLPSGYFWDNHLELGPETAHLTKLTWPRFLIEESDIPEESLEFDADLTELAQRLLVWGIRRESDQKLIASGSAFLIQADITQDSLPDEGWQFATKAFGSTVLPNCVCLIAANVSPDYQSLGFSTLLLVKAKELTLARGFQTLIGPVRPVSKSRFPELSFAEYLVKLTAQGECFDPWLRLHIKLGAQVLNICPLSVIVRASLPRWRNWTGLELKESGEVTLPNGLAPLQIDKDLNVGIYIEPGVWVRYRL